MAAAQPYAGRLVSLALQPMSTADLFPDHRPAEALPEPSREAALERVKAFAASMGRHYASQRNFDFGPDNRSNVSGPMCVTG